MYPVYFVTSRKETKNSILPYAQEALCSPLYFRPGLSPCNLSPINVVCLIVSVDLDPGYQMVARYCGVTCHVSRAVMTRASTQSRAARARCMLSCSVCISRDDRAHLHSVISHLSAAFTGIHSSRAASLTNSAANRLIGEVVQSRRRPLLGPSPG